MNDAKTEAILGGVKLTPPTAAIVSGLTSESVIATLTIIYLVVLITHTIWKWRREARTKA